MQRATSDPVQTADPWSQDSDAVSNGGPLRGKHETRDEMRTQYNTQYNVMREGTEHWDRLFRSVLDSLRALVGGWVAHRSSSNSAG